MRRDEPDHGGLLARAAAMLGRLGPLGWEDLLRAHGLDLSAADLRSELLRELPGIDREIPGFEDFAAEGRRAVEPGDPARSLLYHALASPQVTLRPGGERLEGFPTEAELDALESLVFGIEAPSLAEITARFPDAPLAVVVFATEYRPAVATVHRRHADLCFARTGVARVGTRPPLYDPAVRGHLPFAEGEPGQIRVLPAAYAPYLAAQLPGRRELFGPMNFDLRRRLPGGDAGPSDAELTFWVPLHKLFPGPECLRGIDLDVHLEAAHVNEKLRRVHLLLRSREHDTGHEPPAIDRPPFVLREGIAELAGDPGARPGLVVPVVHPQLVEAAELDGEPLTFVVPPNPGNGFAPSLFLEPPEDGARSAPEYVHVRHVVQDGGEDRDLNDVPDVADQVRAGGYRARHYLDFTGDGWVEAVCPAIAAEVPRNVPAYSLVTAPDFYPATAQRELIEWWVQRVPQRVRDAVWAVPPFTLSDERLPPNLQLDGARFRAEDRTPTAIVALPRGPRAQRPLVDGGVRRHAHLPDAAASVFAPGWDTSRDVLDGAAHLAAYGLGSPFPEDAKLCAAFSAFWPAVAPDAARSFSRPFPTVTPLTDEELGIVGEAPWDGVPGPRIERPGPPATVRYASFDHVDYVASALEGRFTLALTGQVDTAEYQARILSTTWAHLLAGIDRNDRQQRRWRIVSFRSVDPDDPELRAAEQEAGATLPGARYRFHFGHMARTAPAPGDHRQALVDLDEEKLVFAGPLPRALVRSAGTWELRTQP